MSRVHTVSNNYMSLSSSVKTLIQFANESNKYNFASEQLLYDKRLDATRRSSSVYYELEQIFIWLLFHWVLLSLRMAVNRLFLRLFGLTSLDWQVKDWRPRLSDQRFFCLPAWMWVNAWYGILSSFFTDKMIAFTMKTCVMEYFFAFTCFAFL